MTRNLTAEAVHILDSGPASRKELASALRIGLSCAGNIAFTLISAGIVSEYDGRPEPDSKSCRMLYLRRDPVFAVADITERSVTTYVFGYNLSVCDSFTFVIEDPLFLDDCLSSYFRILSAKFPKLRLLTLVSSGNYADGRFNGSGIQRLDDLPLCDMASEHLIGASIELRNRYELLFDQLKGISVVICEDGEAPHTVVIYNGMVISDKSMTNRLGRTEIMNSRSFAAAIRYSSDFEEYAKAISVYVYSLICLVDADRVIYMGERYSDYSSVISSIKERLMLDYQLPASYIPDIVSVHKSDAIITKETLRKIRDEHIKTMI